MDDTAGRLNSMLHLPTLVWNRDNRSFMKISVESVGILISNGAGFLFGGLLGLIGLHTDALGKLTSRQSSVTAASERRRKSSPRVAAGRGGWRLSFRENPRLGGEGAGRREIVGRGRGRGAGIMMAGMREVSHSCLSRQRCWEGR